LKQFIACRLFTGFFIPLALLVSLVNGCSNDTKTPEQAETGPTTPVINFAVTKTFPHDPTLFTEGLLFHDGKLFESTGSPDKLPQTRSLVGTIDLTTGQFDQKIELDKTKYFGEGIVFLKNKLYQLTYKNGMGFIYDARSYKQTGTFIYKNAEGWALTTDGSYLIMSDGTDALTFLDTVSLQPAMVLKVTENNNPLIHLNELEYIHGFIYANVWTTNYIVRIDPSNGNVTGKIDLSSLGYEAKNKNPDVDVLNGIAYDSVADKIYVTGKLWPTIYQVSFSH
jgi:glutaminyl-peptide cyclotransferase